MSPRAKQAFTWGVLVSASLVVLGVFLQVYFIASYFFGAGHDALDAHKNLGGIVHIFEVLAFLAALVAYWKQWAKMAPAFALALIGTIQFGLADADEWVGGFHGVLALVVLILAHAVVQRSVRDLGLGRHGPGAAPQ